MLLLPYTTISLILCCDQFDCGSRLEMGGLVGLSIVDVMILNKNFTRYRLKQGMDVHSHINATATKTGKVFPVMICPNI